MIFARIGDWSGIVELEHTINRNKHSFRQHLVISFSIQPKPETVLPKRDDMCPVSIRKDLGDLLEIGLGTVVRVYSQTRLVVITVRFTPSLPAMWEFENFGKGGVVDE